MPPGHKKVLGCAQSGVGGHIFRGKRARGGKIWPSGHKKVLRCAHSGVGGHISRIKRARGGKIRPPGHKKVLWCAHSGVGGHILGVKRARGGEMQPPGHKKRPGAKCSRSFGYLLGGRLLPLNCCVWFWRHVVAYAVDCRYLCEDSVSDLHEDWPVNLLNCGGHGIHGVYGADDYRPVV